MISYIIAIVSLIIIIVIIIRDHKEIKQFEKDQYIIGKYISQKLEEDLEYDIIDNFSKYRRKKR